MQACEAAGLWSHYTYEYVVRLMRLSMNKSLLKFYLFSSEHWTSSCKLNEFTTNQVEWCQLYSVLNLKYQQSLFKQSKNTNKVNT